MELEREKKMNGYQKYAGKHKEYRKTIKNIFKFEKGATVTEIISGFTGVVIARADYINGNIKYEVQPRGMDKNNNIPKSTWVNENQLVSDPFHETIGFVPHKKNKIKGAC